jgi:hydrogenase-4 membrane subunit HyfE
MPRLFLATAFVCLAGLGSTAFAYDVSQMMLPIAPIGEPVALVLFAGGLMTLASHLRRTTE